MVWVFGSVSPCFLFFVFFVNLILICHILLFTSCLCLFSCSALLHYFISPCVFKSVFYLLSSLVCLCFMSVTHSCILSCFPVYVSRVALGRTGWFSFSVSLGSCFVARFLWFAFGFVDFSFILLKLTFSF